MAWPVPALCPAEGVADLAAVEAAPVALAPVLADAGGLLCGWPAVPVAATEMLPWVAAVGGVGEFAPMVNSR